MGTSLVDPYGVELRVLAGTPELLRVQVTVPGGSGGVTCLDGSPYARSEPVLTSSLRVLSDWESGFCGDLTLTNQGVSPVTGWHVVARFADAKFTSTWNATYSPGDGGQVDIRPLSHNRMIYPSSSVNTGFCAQKLGPAYQPGLVSVTAEGG